MDTQKITNNFCSVRALSEDEARDIYSKMSKEKLIDMLIQCNRAIDELFAELGNMNRSSNSFPFYDGGNYNKSLDCTDWMHCKNPQRDCFNCPLRYPTVIWTDSFSTSSNGFVSGNEKTTALEDEQ